MRRLRRRGAGPVRKKVEKAGVTILNSAECIGVRDLSAVLQTEDRERMVPADTVLAV